MSSSLRVLCTWIFVFCLSAGSDAVTIKQQPAPSTAQTVDLVVYYESMCPYSRAFIINQLYPTFKKLGSSVLKLTMVPYGITREVYRNNKWMFSCQHGPAECTGNIIQACALNITGHNPDVYMPFVNCMEANTRHGLELTALHKCSSMSNVSETPVTGCLRGDMGRQLEHQLGLVTHKANIHNVPWLEINGVQLNTMASHTNLLAFLCNYIKNSNCPKATIVG